MIAQDELGLDIEVRATPGFERSADSDAFFAAVDRGANVFLTGMAGTGKSHLIREWLGRLGANRQPVDVTASTGIAALNIGGLTVHRWCGMMLGPAEGQSNARYFAELSADTRMGVRRGFNRVRACRRLVLDEISMLPGRVLSFLDYLCRRLRETDAPFGGIQVVATGDFLQLPPVRKGEGAYDWAFLAPEWSAADFAFIQLQKIHRQVSDPRFARALAAFRVGDVRAAAAATLRSRVLNFPPSDLVRLYTHNAQVDKWNEARLEALDGELYTFDAELGGPEPHKQFLVNNVLSPLELGLKVGARVMITVNDAQQRWVNGDTGAVHGFGRNLENEETVEVRLDRGEIVAVPRFTWKFDHKDETSGAMVQFPLRLGYALTIHKSQGLTLAGAYVDARAAREPGQAYVALSRVRTLDGLWLKEWMKGVFVSDHAKAFYQGYRDGRSKTAAAPVLGALATQEVVPSVELAEAAGY